MEEAQEFLNNWVNNVENEQVTDETLEYSEREVIKMLEDYKLKHSTTLVTSDVKTFTCTYRLQDSCKFKGVCHDEDCLLDKEIQ